MILVGLPEGSSGVLCVILVGLPEGSAGVLCVILVGLPEGSSGVQCVILVGLPEGSSGEKPYPRLLVLSGGIILTLGLEDLLLFLLPCKRTATLSITRNSQSGPIERVGS